MRIKLLLSILSVLLIVTAHGLAQDSARTIAGGVLNGKATSLVKPVYPAAARAVRAEGAVNVQVTIDEEGNVIAASAVSGHPLLRAAAVEAARASKFSPTLLSGQSVKVTGVIVYNFYAGGTMAKDDLPPVKSVSMTASWLQAGQTLSALDKTTTLKYFEPSSLNYIIPAGWTAEREQIQRLEELKKAEMEMPQSDSIKERVVDQSTMTDANKKPVKTSTIIVAAPSERKVSSEVSAISQSLISSIQGRLASNEMDLWNFNLGVNINKALLNADSRDAQKRIEGAKILRDFANSAPSTVTAETIGNIIKIADLAEKGIFSSQEVVEVTRLMTKLNVSP